MKKKLLTIGEKILRAFNPDKIETISEDLTNKKILEQLVEVFKSMLENESVGQRMLYPMSFNILMHPDDYDNRKQSLPYVLPEVVLKFHAIIDDMQKEYPDYTPTAKYWHFQFSPYKLEEKIKVGNTFLLVEKGKISTVATLLTSDIQDAHNVSVDNNVRVSIKLEGSRVMNGLNFNSDAIKNVMIYGESRFTCKFDNTLSRDTKQIKDNFNISEVNGMAEFSYSKGGQNYHFLMQDKLLHISGRNDMRTGRSIFKLESDTIKDSHVQIKYDTEEMRFKIAAFGLTKVNGRELNISEGGNIYWYDLANKSSIFINDEIKVEFKIKEN